MLAQDTLDEYQVVWAPVPVQDLAPAVHRSHDGLLVECVCSAGQLILRAPYQLAVRRHDERCDDERFATVLLAKAFGTGLLRSDLPGYRPDLAQLMNQLEPRTQPNRLTDMVELLHVKVRRNAFGNARWPLVLLGLPSFLSSSCLPNLEYTSDPVLREYRFVALRRIEADEELTICSHPFPIDSRQARQQLYPCECRYCEQDRPPSLDYPALKPLVRTRHCWWCGAAAATPCSGCGTAHYCSQQCEQCNRATHQRICTRL